MDMLTTKSTPEQWAKQARELFEKKLYEYAAINFERAGEEFNAARSKVGVCASKRFVLFVPSKLYSCNLTLAYTVRAVITRKRSHI